ncbi:dihydrofolate reductase family protein [Nitratireductor sp. GCM10026969]|uniref:dihydrofolate reductase family protein n=1 Tax=Nitratireductor sp. GCM10026969 TaxID=3252645 RepID=UPI00360A5CD8
MPTRRTIDDPAGFARKLNAMRKYVASNTLEEATWTNTTILSGDVIGAVRDIKAENGGDIIIYGSAGLVHGLLPHGLVDKVHMLIYPTVLGRGTRLFPAGYASAFELGDLRRLACIAALKSMIGFWQGNYADIVCGDAIYEN